MKSKQRQDEAIGAWKDCILRRHDEQKGWRSIVPFERALDAAGRRRALSWHTPRATSTASRASSTSGTTRCSTAWMTLSTLVADDPLAASPRRFRLSPSQSRGGSRLQLRRGSCAGASSTEAAAKPDPAVPSTMARQFVLPCACGAAGRRSSSPTRRPAVCGHRQAVELSPPAEAKDREAARSRCAAPAPPRVDLRLRDSAAPS